MTAKFGVLLLFLELAANCGASSSDRPADKGGHQAFPTERTEVGDPVGTNGSLFSTEQRLLNFDDITGQVSVINPATGSLHLRQAGYRSALFVVPVNQYQSFVAIYDDRAEIVGGDGEQITLTWNDDVLDFAIASDISGIGLVAINPEGDTVRHINFSTSRIDEEFAIPWATENNTPRPVLFYDEQGTVLVVLDILTGDYSVFRFTGGIRGSEFVGPCQGPGPTESGAIRYRAGVLDLAGDSLMLGNTEGEVVRVELNDCSDFSAKINLSGQPILRLSTVQSGEFLVSQKESVTEISLAGGSLIEKKKFSTSCSHPGQVMPLGAAFSHLAIACLTPTNYDPKTQSPPLLVDYDQVTIQVHEAADPAVPREFAIFTAKLAGQGLDRDTSTLYLMYKGVFGELETINLLTGTRETRKNVLIDDILE